MDQATLAYQAASEEIEPNLALPAKKVRDQVNVSCACISVHIAHTFSI